MPIRSFIEVDPPSHFRYLAGAAVMMIGVVLPFACFMFRQKRLPSTSEYSKQTPQWLTTLTCCVAIPGTKFWCKGR